MKMKPKFKIIISILLLIFIISCSSIPSASKNNHSNVYHIVICWLKEPNNKEQRQKLIEESKKLQSIPGIISIEAGNMLPSERPIVDSSFDIGIIMSFKDEKTMHEYLLNPLHQKAANEILKPLTSKVVVYDFVKSE